MADNIITHSFIVGRKERNRMLGHNSFLIFFTGLSGSGKSTIANNVEVKLHKKDIHTYILDGDNVRNGLNKDLGFSEEERTENQRRIGEVAKLFIDAGTVVLASFISPLRKDRQLIAETVGEENFIEIFVNTSLEECERRDVKGLYKKARAGEIKNFTGISAPYEKPNDPALELNTEHETLEESVEKVIQLLKQKLENIEK